MKRKTARGSKQNLRALPTLDAEELRYVAGGGGFKPGFPGLQTDGGFRPGNPGYDAAGLPTGQRL